MLIIYTISFKDNYHLQVCQYLQKSLRCLTQNPDWEKDIDGSEKVAQLSIELAQMQLQMVEQLENNQRGVQLLNGCKLTVKGNLARIKVTLKL